MSNIMNDLHAIGLNPFAVTLLAESMLKSAYVKHKGVEPLTFSFPVQRTDCAGWLGVRITIEAVPVEATSPSAEGAGGGEQRNDEKAKSLYNAFASNHPTIHCNRFAAWEELDEKERNEWRRKASQS